MTVVIDALENGGTQRVAMHLLSAWVAAGHPVSVITLHDASNDYFKLPKEAVRFVIGGVRRSRTPLAGVLANLQRIRRLRRALKASGPRAILSFITSTNILVILASLGLGIRVVISERNDPLRQNPGLRWKVLRRMLYRLADIVTANSTHAIDVMAGYVPRRKLIMMPNPVLQPDTIARPHESRTLINVGRLVPQKGQRIIVSAFARVSLEFSDWRLLILGEGPERRGLMKCIDDHKLGDRASLPGNVSDPTAHYNAAGVFVLASAYEGTPNALLEAMSHGLPCIVPDNLPGALEHVQDGISGLVYRAGNQDDLVRCLFLLIRDPSLRVRLGREARERMRAYSLERIVKVWNGLLFQPRPPSA